MATINLAHWAATARASPPCWNIWRPDLPDSGALVTVDYNAPVTGDEALRGSSCWGQNLYPDDMRVKGL